MGTQQQEQSLSDRDRWRQTAAAIEVRDHSGEERLEDAATPDRPLGRDGQSIWRAQEALEPFLAALEDKRRHTRQDWTARLHLTIEQLPGCSLGRNETHVATKDLSRSGFSFIYRQYIPEGTLITARIESIPSIPTLRGEVRRCAHMAGMDHLVGVEFTKGARS